MHLIAFVLALLTSPAAAPAVAPAATPAQPAFGPHVIYGIVRLVSQESVTIERRNGTLSAVDVSYARALGRTGPLYPGRAVAIYGDYDAAKRFHANAVTSANGLLRDGWPPDH